MQACYTYSLTYPGLPTKPDRDPLHFLSGFVLV